MRMTGIHAKLHLDFEDVYFRLQMRNNTVQELLLRGGYSLS